MLIDILKRAMIYYVIYSASMGRDINVIMTVMITIGIMLMITGYYLPECRPNGAIGIRLPWTLCDDDVWQRTHRIRGILFILGGLALIYGGTTDDSAFSIFLYNI